jgi:hypothetical protein
VETQGVGRGKTKSDAVVIESTSVTQKMFPEDKLQSSINMGGWREDEAVSCNLKI